MVPAALGMLAMALAVSISASFVDLRYLLVLLE